MNAVILYLCRSNPTMYDPTPTIWNDTYNATEGPVVYKDIISSDDATWVLISAFIIFTMQSGRSSSVASSYLPYSQVDPHQWLHHLYHAVRWVFINAINIFTMQSDMSSSLPSSSLPCSQVYSHQCLHYL